MKRLLLLVLLVSPAFIYAQTRSASTAEQIEGHYFHTQAGADDKWSALDLGKDRFTITDLYCNSEDSALKLWDHHKAAGPGCKYSVAGQVSGKWYIDKMQDFRKMRLTKETLIVLEMSNGEKKYALHSLSFGLPVIILQQNNNFFKEPFTNPYMYMQDAQYVP